MKILLLNQAFYPDKVATAQILVDLALHLKDTGCQVTVISGKRGYEDRKARYTSREDYHGIHIERVGSTGFGKGRIVARIFDFLSFDLCLLWKLWRTPRQDVVISFTSPPMVGVIGAMFCKLKGGLCVQWLMDVNPDAAIAVGYLREKSLLARVLTRIFRSSLAASDLVVVLDRWMKERITSHGVPEDRIAVVPPWSVVEGGQNFSDEKERIQSFKARLGLSGKFVVLYSGNHSVVHPLDTLLETARRMDRDYPEVCFAFVGGGVRVKDVHRAVRRFGLRNIVQLAPQPRGDLHELLQAADVHVVVMGEKVSGLVHTSKIYSILASGKPYIFVGPTRSHVSDLMKECPFGYQVRNGDVEGLVKTLDLVRALSAEELEKTRQGNVQYVKDNFEPGVVMGKFLESLKHSLPH